jgi:hypothetical protein
VGWTFAQIACGDKVKKLRELVYFRSPAHRREHVMSYAMYVVPLFVVRAQKNLYVTSRARYSVCVGASTLVNEATAVVNGAVRITFRVEIPVRSPAITDDRSAGFDPRSYNGYQSVGGSVRNGSEKRFTRLAFNTAKYPLPLDRVAPIIFAPTKLAFVDLDGLVRNANFLRAAIWALRVAQIRG